MGGLLRYEAQPLRCVCQDTVNPMLDIPRVIKRQIMTSINKLTENPVSNAGDLIPIWDDVNQRTRAVSVKTLSEYIEPATEKFVASGVYSDGTLTLTYNDATTITITGFSFKSTELTDMPSALTAGKVLQVKADGTGYELVDPSGVGKDLLYHDTVNNRLVSTIPIQTTLASLFLKDAISLSSSGNDLAIRNIDNSDYAYPVNSVLHDHSIPINRTSVGAERAAANDFGAPVDDGSGGFQPRGDAATSGAVDFVLDTTLAQSLSIFEILVIAEEDIDPEDTLYYSIYAGSSTNDREVYEQELTGITVAQGGDFNWNFKGNSNLLAGDPLHVEMLIDKGSQGNGTRPLRVRPSASQPTEIYAKLLGRAYSIKTVAYKDEVDALISGSEYKGAWAVTTNPSQLDNLTPSLGDTYRIDEAGTHDLGFGSTDFQVGDFVVWNGAGWDYYPLNSATIGEIESASFAEYDITVDSEYRGSVSTGSSLRPFKTLSAGIAAAVDGSTILVKGDHTNLTSELTLPNSKSLHFYGQNNTKVGYASYSASNGNVFYVDALSNTKSYTFNGLIIQNAGGYGIHTKNTARVTVEDCTLQFNGWNGSALNTVLPSASSGLLGFDSSQADLQAFYAGANASDGGALRIENSTFIEVISNTVQKNLRGIRVQDCGIGGAGFVTRNISTQNIESGIYVAAGSLGGCRNIIVTINSSAYNANNGLLCIGGINNKFSQNEVNGNWNAGFCAWGSANTTLRDCGLYDNNRSEFNGIGNTGDAKASIQINEAFNYLGNTIPLNPDARFIAEILDTQVHYTGLGSNTDKVGFLITADVGNLADNDKNIIKVDDVGFIGQDYAVDFSEVDLTNLRVSLGDNSYQSIGEKAIKSPLAGSYFELPFSNHSMQFPEVDFSVTNTGNVEIREGVGGNIINPYMVNQLQALAYKTDIKVVIKGTDKIQFTVPVSGASIDGNLVNSVQSIAVTQLNDLFTNTTGFASGGNPVTNFALSNNDLTLTLQDGTSFTVDVTTLGVDENKFVSSGALNGSNLELTMNDSSIVTIDASNMINGSTLPAVAGWRFAYGSNANNPVNSNVITNGNKDSLPFYYGTMLERGKEFIWQHDTTGTLHIGHWGSTTSATGVAGGADTYWITKFKIGTSLVANSTGGGGFNTVGTDIDSRYSTGYAVNQNTLLALRHDNDGFLTLFDISNGGYTIIAKANTTTALQEIPIHMVGVFNSGTGFITKIPSLVERTEMYEVYHDFDSSESDEWADGVEAEAILKSNAYISPGDKFLININSSAPDGAEPRLGFDYSGATTGESNAYNLIGRKVTVKDNDGLQLNSDWNFNTSATYYRSADSQYRVANGTPVGMVEIRYNTDNSIELYSQTHGELIATLAANANGSDLHIFYGFDGAVSGAKIWEISKQDMSQSSQPITTFAPDISDQSFDVTKGQAFNSQIALDSGSDIVNQYVELDAPTWAVLNQSTGEFTGTAPSTTGSHVINCKAANAVGGATSFTITLNVVEPVYTNTKSLRFVDGNSNYLGGNAALVTALERSGNGSGSSEAWTIAFWLKGSTVNQGQTLFYFGANDVVNNGHIEVKQTNSNGQKRIRFRYGTNVNHIQLTTSPGSINPSNWQHVLISYDGGTTGAASNSLSSYYSRFKIYIDGQLQSTSNSHSNNGYTGSVVGQNYRFGRFSSGNYARGVLLNQLAIWNSDQSSNVSGLYNSGNTQDISLLQAGDGSMNANYLAPDHYYEIETSVTAIQDLAGTAHFVGYNFVSSDLVTDVP